MQLVHHVMTVFIKQLNVQAQSEYSKTLKDNVSLSKYLEACSYKP